MSHISLWPLAASAPLCVSERERSRVQGTLQDGERVPPGQARHRRARGPQVSPSKCLFWSRKRGCIQITSGWVRRKQIYVYTGSFVWSLLVILYMYYTYCNIGACLHIKLEYLGVKFPQGSPLQKMLVRLQGILDQNVHQMAPVNSFHTALSTWSTESSFLKMIFEQLVMYDFDFRCIFLLL